MGYLALVLALFAIGVSYILVATADNSNKQILSFGGYGSIIIALVIFFLIPKARKEFKNKNEDIEFIHEIILKIEEKLPNRT